MRSYLLVALLLVSPFALADERRCLISFDSAQLNVCNQRVWMANPGLGALADTEAHADSPIRVLKFEGPITAAQRVAVESAGAEILGYAPFYAYVVRMAPTLDGAIRRIDGVLWTGPFLPIWKLDVNLARDLGGARIVEQGGLDRLTVELHPGSSEAAARGALIDIPGLHFEVTESARDRERLVVRFERDALPAAVDRLARLDDVASVSLRWENRFMNSQAGWLHQSGVNNQRPIFDQGIYGCGQIVAAADSGLHATHCSFVDTDFGTPVMSTCNTGSSCPSITPDFDHRKVGAHYKWSGNGSSVPVDDHGHGTHVMGSLAGNNPAGAVDCETFTTPGGNTDLDGTAPGAHLISQEMGAGLQYLNTLGGTAYHAASIAYENGARIHNNSWGSSCRNQQNQCIAGCLVPYRQTTRDADAVVWDFPELAVFFAAGNSGSVCGPGADVGAAGNGKNVFSIGNNLRGTSGNGMSSGSSRGPTSDRRTKPDLTAQGSSIRSSQRNTSCGTTTMSGTSMASPTAAGLAALARDYLARGFYPSGVATPGDAISTPSSALIKAMMINGAHEITGSGSGGAAPSTSQGWGQVRLENVLYFDGDARNLWLVDEKTGLQTGQVDEHPIHAEAGQPLTVTLVWHDFPATVNAMPHWVNQLRLEVVEPNGTTVWTQKLTPGGGLNDPNPFQGTSLADYDDVNNVHQIRFDTPKTGIYTARVRGIQVAMGDNQPYALAATGIILPGDTPDFVLESTAESVEICAGDPAQFTIGALALGGFDDAVDLSVDGVPAPATAGFSVNPIVPTDPASTSILEIGNTGAVASGIYPLLVEGDSNGPDFDPLQRSLPLSLAVTAAVPAAEALLQPADSAVDQPVRPVLLWEAFDETSQYRVQIARDAGFSNIVVDATVDETQFEPSIALLAQTTYFWRVAGLNACGEGIASTAFSFTTGENFCATPGLQIADGSAEGVSATLPLLNGGTIENLRVSVDVEHSWVGDLTLRLAKGATEVLLVDRPDFTGAGTGCNGNDIRVTLDDDAALSIQDDCTSGIDPTQAYIADGTYTPAASLAAFDGTELQGTWTLTVVDGEAGEEGVLNGWCLLPTLQAPDPDALFGNGFEALF